MSAGIERAVDDVVSFGPFQLDPVRRRLTRGGVPVRIGDRALDILMVLVAHAPEIVGKNALIEQVWPGLHVEESNLRFQMIALRKALDGGDYISTVQGRGYCLVVPVERAGDAAPARTAQSDGTETAATVAPATNLPQYLTGLVGRDNELAKLRDCLSEYRLITLVGPGGVGKTRLAVELGRQLLPNFPGGVWLVDLAPLSDPAAVVNATAVALRTTFSTMDTAAGAIVSALGRKRSLLIFDNCEHLVSAVAALVKSLLEREPALTLLATSQQALRLPAEQLYLVPPLGIPPDEAADISGFGAAELFVERARAADGSFALDRRGIAGVVEICRRLDGLPLALEMAASRLRMLGLEGLCAALDHRLRLLKGAQHGAETRHGSLGAMVEWSQGLLDADERHLFRDLAVFPGSFTLEAAIAVGNDGAADRWTLVDTLGRLVDKSLVTVENRTPPRYRLLETLRLHAGEKLRDSGAWDQVAERHARHVAETLRRAELDWQNTSDPEWLALHEPELDNLRAALAWALAEPGRGPIALSLGGPGIHLLSMLSLITEGQRYFDRLVPLVASDTPPEIEAALLAWATPLWRRASGGPALDRMHRAASLYRALGDAPRLGMTLAAIGIHDVLRQQFQGASSTVEEAWALVARCDRRKVRLSVLLARAVVTSGMGAYGEARTHLVRALPLAQALKSTSEMACLNNLAIQEYCLDNLAGAVEWQRKAVACVRATPGQPRISLPLINLAAFLLALDKSVEARGVAEEAFSRLVESDVTAFSFLQIWAVLAASEGRLADAARLIGFVEAERALWDRPLQGTERRLYDMLCNRLDAGLRPDDLRAYRLEGSGWDEAGAIEFLERALLPPPVPR